MKIIKVIFGTVLGLATVCYVALFAQTLIRFIHVWVTAGYSPQGLSETGGALVAVCIGAAFTVWTFQSAFRKPTSRKEEAKTRHEAETARDAEA